VYPNTWTTRNDMELYQVKLLETITEQGHVRRG
jgi:hypothetical protein